MLSDRQRALVRHTAIPRDERPLNDEQICEVIGVPVRTYRNWAKNNDEFRLAVKREQEELEKNAKDALALRLRTIALEQLYKEMAGSEGETKRKYLTTILAETKGADDTVGAVSFANFSLGELIVMAMQLDLDAPGVDREEIERLAIELGRRDSGSDSRASVRDRGDDGAVGIVAGISGGEGGDGEPVPSDPPGEAGD